jgi:hypothetical protein
MHFALFKPNYQYADHTADQAQENKLNPYYPNLTMLATTEKEGASKYGRLNVQHQRGRWPSPSCRSAARALRAAREVHLISRSLIRLQKYLTARQYALHPCKALQFDSPYLSLISLKITDFHSSLC